MGYKASSCCVTTSVTMPPCGYQRASACVSRLRLAGRIKENEREKDFGLLSSPQASMLRNGQRTEDKMVL